VTFGFAALNGDESVPSETVLDQVEYAADVSDFTIVSVSWSEDADAERMKNTVRTLANAGADVIVGHSSGLGSAEWIDRADGNRTLAVYSLGNILSTSDNTADLIGGMLTFTVTSGADGFKIESPVLEPTFTHYTTEYRDYQVFRMAEYSDELAANHAIAGTCNDAVRNIVCGTVPAEFLPAAFRS